MNTKEILNYIGCITDRKPYYKIDCRLCEGLIL